jgi:adenine-specific DNA-methyltransferase
VQEFRDARGALVLRVATLQEAVAELQRLSRPFLDWAGKAERLSFEVPTLPEGLGGQATRSDRRRSPPL